MFPCPVRQFWAHKFGDHIHSNRSMEHVSPDPLNLSGRSGSPQASPGRQGVRQWNFSHPLDAQIQGWECDDQNREYRNLWLLSRPAWSSMSCLPPFRAPFQTSIRPPIMTFLVRWPILCMELLSKWETSAKRILSYALCYSPSHTKFSTSPTQRTHRELYRREIGCTGGSIAEYSFELSSPTSHITQLLNLRQITPTIFESLSWVWKALSICTFALGRRPTWFSTWTTASLILHCSLPMAEHENWWKFFKN